MPGRAIVRSDFDSAAFGVEFFRVATREAAAIADAVLSLPEGPLIVDAKVAADDFAMIAVLDAAGFRKASTLVEFGASPDKARSPDSDVRREVSLTASDLDAHAQGFRFQRFRQDSRIPAAGSVELMRRWITNTLAGRREVLALGRNFCSYAVDGSRLTIDLLSCADAGQGVAGRLLTAIHAEAAARGCSELRVTTEAENIVAMRVYLRAGFVPVRSWAAMHLVRS